MRAISSQGPDAARRCDAQQPSSAHQPSFEPPNDADYVALHAANPAGRNPNYNRRRTRKSPLTRPGRDRGRRPGRDRGRQQSDLRVRYILVVLLGCTLALLLHCNDPAWQRRLLPQDIHLDNDTH